MDDLRVGALARAVRHRLGWTQHELGVRIGVSQQVVSLFERGHLEELTMRTARRIAVALEIQLVLAPRWRGGDGVRLLDADHAAVVNAIVGLLKGAGWEVAAEYTFNHYGERGSIDVVAWHAEARCLLIVGVKSRLLDSQDTLGTLDRKMRIAPQVLARERGWDGASLGVVLAMPGLTANRNAVGRHGATFAAALPARGPAVRRWIRQPGGDLRGVWFLSDTSPPGGTRVNGTRRRVRVPRARSPRADDLRTTSWTGRQEAQAERPVRTTNSAGIQRPDAARRVGPGWTRLTDRR